MRGGTWLAFAAQQVGPDGGLPAGTTGFGAQLFQSVVALVAVCMTAWLVLRWIAQRGPNANRATKNLRVIERVALDPRKSIYLVEAGTRVFLVGASDQSVNALAELSRADLAAPPASGSPSPAPRFAEVLARIRRVGVTAEPKRDEPDADTGTE